MKRTITALAWLTFVVAAGSAHAHDDETGAGWRIGGSAIISTLKRDDDLIDDGQIGFKVFGQYKFNKWFGIEGAYYNSGEFSSDATSASGSKVELLYQGLLGHGLLYIPLPWESLEFFLKGGYFALNVDSTIDGANSGKGTDNGAVLGTGVSVHVSERMHLRTSVDWYDTQGAELWSVELGLAYLF